MDKEAAFAIAKKADIELKDMTGESHTPLSDKWKEITNRIKDI